MAVESSRIYGWNERIYDILKDYLAVNHLSYTDGWREIMGEVYNYKMRL
jgi:hypothetical protein